MMTVLQCILCVLAGIFLVAYLEEMNRRQDIEHAIDKIPASTYVVISHEETETTPDGTRIGFIEVCAILSTKRDRIKIAIRRFVYHVGDHKSLGQAIGKAEALVEHLNSF